MDLTTLFTGRFRKAFDSLDSTSAMLHRLLKDHPLPEGAAVTSLFQTVGRGQQRAGWHSQAGMNLLVSFLFFPASLSARHAFGLNLAAALAVRDAAESLTGERLTIKWPNDIYAGDRKLAGILVENTLQGDTVRQSVIGVGLNVNQKSFPAELPNPVSMTLLTGQVYSLDEVFWRLASALERRYLQLKTSGSVGLRPFFEEQMYRKGVWSTFSAHGQVFEGMILGMDPCGRLLVRLPNEEQRVFDVKELTYL